MTFSTAVFIIPKHSDYWLVVGKVGTEVKECYFGKGEFLNIKQYFSPSNSVPYIFCWYRGKLMPCTEFMIMEHTIFLMSICDLI